MASLKKHKAISYCPICHKIWKGPMKDTIWQIDETEMHEGKPIRIAGNPVSYDLCPDCEKKDLPRAQFKDIMAEQARYKRETAETKERNEKEVNRRFIDFLKKMGAKSDNSTSN